jgi:transposase InsO family protein
MEHEKKVQMAAFRYSVISPLLDSRLGKAERQGERERLLAHAFELPDGTHKRLHERTVRKWVARFRKGGFDGLIDGNRKTLGTCRAIPQEVLDQAEKLRRELSSRSVPQIIDMLKEGGVDTGKFSSRTLNQQLNKHGAFKCKPKQERGTFQRWGQEFANVLWQADTAHGVWLPDPVNPKRVRKTKLISFIDDCTRVCTYAAFYWDEQLPSLVDCFRKALLSYGKPERLLCDNAWTYHSTTMNVFCGRLDIKVSFCQKYRPQGKGKIERKIGSFRSRFISEANHADLRTLEELNEFFFAWLEEKYHNKEHEGLNGLTPLERWRQDEERIERVTIEQVSRALMLEVERTVNVRTGTIRLDNKFYQADAQLAGARVRVRFAAGEREQVEIWRNQRLVQLAKRVAIPTQIDFSRKPEVLAEEPGIAYEGSRSYRQRLTARAKPEVQLEPEAARAYLTEPELAKLLSGALIRELTELERVDVAKFFLRNAPISSEVGREAFELAISAKGTNMHLRFYFHTLEQQLNKRRS